MRGKAIFVAALAAGLSYWPASRVAFDPALLTVWKGAGVGLLAFWAARTVPGGDGRLLALVLALGALGDVLLAAVSLEVGALAFLAGHGAAVRLYRRHRRPGRGDGLFLAVPLLAGAAALAAGAGEAAPGVALYSLGLGAMAVAATLSRFPGAAIGAWAFVASDLLIFARLGPLAGSAVPDLLIWPLYFGGQAMIAWSVGKGLATGVTASPAPIILPSRPG